MFEIIDRLIGPDCHMTRWAISAIATTTGIGFVFSGIVYWLTYTEHDEVTGPDPQPPLLTLVGPW